MWVNGMVLGVTHRGFLINRMMSPQAICNSGALKCSLCFHPIANLVWKAIKFLKSCSQFAPCTGVPNKNCQTRQLWDLGIVVKLPICSTLISAHTQAIVRSNQMVQMLCQLEPQVCNFTVWIICLEQAECFAVKTGCMLEACQIEGILILEPQAMSNVGIVQCHFPKLSNAE